MARLVCAVLLAASFTGACSDSSDCSSESEAAEKFIASHQECSVDADCAVESVGCAELEGAYCGQVSLSRSAAESSTWKELRRDLADCHEGDSCASCGAGLLPTCVNSRCGG
jgi:hypothetical protein